MRTRLGFSLAEVLIALALLGIVAAFAMPKMIQSVGNTQKKSVWTEVTGALSDVAYQGRLNQAFPNQLGQESQVVQYFSSRINAVKVCPTSMVDEGCWPSGVAFGSDLNHDEEHGPGFVFHNGAVAACNRSFYDPDWDPQWPSSAKGTPRQFGRVFVFNVDWNGPSGKNDFNNTARSLNRDVIQLFMGVDQGQLPWSYGIIKAEDQNFAIFLKS